MFDFKIKQKNEEFIFSQTGEYTNRVKTISNQNLKPMNSSSTTNYVIHFPVLFNVGVLS